MADFPAGGETCINLQSMISSAAWQILDIHHTIMEAIQQREFEMANPQLCL